MAQTELTCDTLGDLDGGRARGIINAALSRIMDDLEDRGDDEKKRTIDVKLSFVRRKGNLVVDVQAAAKCPPYQSAETVASLTQKSKKGGAGLRNAVTFQEHSADNPDQPTFSTMDGQR